MSKIELKTKTRLNAAIRKLENNHQMGHEIRELLELGPKGNARDGELRRAADEVGSAWGRELEIERARKLVEFSKKYTEGQLRKLVDTCRRKGYCPEFGVIIRLLPLKPRERNRLQRKAIEERWKKTRLNQEIARSKPAEQLVDPVRRGRRPSAIKSLDSLTGEALVDARKWGRILDFLEQDKSSKSVWKKLSKQQQGDLRIIAETLLRLSQGSL